MGLDLDDLGFEASGGAFYDCPFALCDPAVSAGGHSGERQHLR